MRKLGLPIETIFEMMDLKVKGVSKLDSPQNSPS
jgi:hypothetical protein